MRRLVTLIATALLALVLAGTAQAAGQIEMWSEKDIYDVGTEVTLYAENVGDEVVSVPGFGGSHIAVCDEKGNHVYWSPWETDEIIPMHPGEIRTWTWDQAYDTYVFDPVEQRWVPDPRNGEQVPAGTYTAYQLGYGSVSFVIGELDYPGNSDGHISEQGMAHGQGVHHWANP